MESIRETKYSSVIFAHEYLQHSFPSESISSSFCYGFMIIRNFTVSLTYFSWDHRTA